MLVLRVVPLFLWLFPEVIFPQRFIPEVLFPQRCIPRVVLPPAGLYPGSPPSCWFIPGLIFPLITVHILICVVHTSVPGRLFPHNVQKGENW